jgi:hypothetical protein
VRGPEFNPRLVHVFEYFPARRHIGGPGQDILGAHRFGVFGAWAKLFRGIERARGFRSVSSFPAAGVTLADHGLEWGAL